MISDIVPNAEIRFAAGEAADFVQYACSGNIEEPNSFPVSTITKVGIVKVNKIIGVH